MRDASCPPFKHGFRRSSAHLLGTNLEIWFLCFRHFLPASPCYSRAKERDLCAPSLMHAVQYPYFVIHVLYIFMRDAFHLQYTTAWMVRGLSLLFPPSYLQSKPPLEWHYPLQTSSNIPSVLLPHCQSQHCGSATFNTTTQPQLFLVNHSYVAQVRTFPGLSLHPWAAKGQHHNTPSPRCSPSWQRSSAAPALWYPNVRCWEPQRCLRWNKPVPWIIEEHHRSFLWNEWKHSNCFCNATHQVFKHSQLLKWNNHPW